MKKKTEMKWKKKKEKEQLVERLMYTTIQRFKLTC